MFIAIKRYRGSNKKEVIKVFPSRETAEDFLEESIERALKEFPEGRSERHGDCLYFDKEPSLWIEEVNSKDFVPNVVERTFIGHFKRFIHED